MGRPVFRVEPALPAHLVKTYAIASPVETHFRPATCAETECAAYRNGWQTAVDLGSTLGQQQAKFIRERSGRRYTMEFKPGGGLLFTFPGGQRCFTPHRAPLERPALYVVRDGDWRGNPRRTEPQLLTADQWVDDFGEHQDRLKTALDQG